MSDEVDVAQDVVELTSTVAVLAIRHQLQAAGSEYCQACGATIPVARRQAAPWAETCTPCWSTGIR
ncbi:TraR/DksA C4-type zinc finger protein [Klebsiella aerogenes]|uniref:TraR/DksA C4-type zinc finger protein n=1 Tax=Klebsiella aerogenes TaxID=548 RepID=UPI0032DB2DF8